MTDESTGAHAGVDPVSDPTLLAALGLEAASDADVAAIEGQLGRMPRGVIGIASRCPSGHPNVVATAPRLPDGTPFPTTFYATCPTLTGAISTLEASGLMREMSERLDADADAATSAPDTDAADGTDASEGLAAAYAAAHDDYLARRARLGTVPEIEGISAGGMPRRVKCLHVLVGHSLAAGRGVNPLGDEAIDALAERGLWPTGACAAGR